MKKLALLFVFVNSLIFAQGEQRYADGTATDQDGNTFEYIKYGDQYWSIENAEVVTYRDGTPIPQVTDPSEWPYLTTGAWRYYDNDPTKGKFYNWYAVSGVHDNDASTPNKEFAPEGWKVPSDEDWTDFENFLISNGYNYDYSLDGDKTAKSLSSINNWTESVEAGTPGSNQSGNNRSGFNAMPNGYIPGCTTCYGDLFGQRAYFYSSSITNNSSAWYRVIRNNHSDIYRDPHGGYKEHGLSVRFVTDVKPNTSSLILLNGTVSAENNQIKNVADPTDAQDVTTKSYVDNSVSNTYTQAEVDNIISETIAELQDQIDALQAATGSGTVTDQDGNSYPYLTYGGQVWTVKNAEMVTYRDGTEIPQVTDNTEWQNLTTGAWAYYNNDPTKPRLYNWYAVMGIHDTDPNTPNKHFAPEGWHVPTDAEWTTLEEYLIANGYNYDDTTTENKIAKAMSSTTGWNSSTELGAIGNDQSTNNSSGFNVFPEGSRNDYGSFGIEGYVAIFWSSTEYNSNNAWDRSLGYNVSDLNRASDNTRYGFSVRFVRD